MTAVVRSRPTNSSVGRRECSSRRTRACSSGCLHPTASWTAPQGAGSDRIAGYRIEATRRYRWGRTWRTERVVFDAPGRATTLPLPGLGEGRQYNLCIKAYDANGDLVYTTFDRVDLAFLFPSPMPTGSTVTVTVLPNIEASDVPDTNAANLLASVTLSLPLNASSAIVTKPKT